MIICDGAGELTTIGLPAVMTMFGLAMTEGAMGNLSALMIGSKSFTFDELPSRYALSAAVMAEMGTLSIIRLAGLRCAGSDPRRARMR